VRVIITGGAGFIGSALAYEAVATGLDCLIIDKLTYAGVRASIAPLEAAGKLQFLQADICDLAAMKATFATFAPEGVFHLAAESHVDRSISGAGDFIQTNVVGTFTLLEAARAYWDALKGGAKERFRFVHISTDEVYGSLGPDGAFRENTAYDPRSPYSASKASSDHLVQAWGHTYGLPIVIGNCSNNYGPRQLPEKLIPLMILNALDGFELPVYGDGKNIRDWLYVDDHARALLLILEKGRSGEKYNIGGGNERTNLEVVHAICDALDQRRPLDKRRRELIAFVQDRPGHDRRYAIDATKIETELGWRAQESFETGLARTVDWYLANEDWWGPLRKAGHGGKRLGLRP